LEWILVLVESPQVEIEKTEFKDSYGTIFEGIRTDGSYACKLYYPIFLMRRLAYSAILVAFGWSPILQLILTVSVIVGPVFLS